VEGTDWFGGSLKFGGVGSGVFPPVGFQLCLSFDLEYIPLLYNANKICMV